MSKPDYWILRVAGDRFDVRGVYTDECSAKNAAYDLSNNDHRECVSDECVRYEVVPVHIHPPVESKPAPKSDLRAVAWWVRGKGHNSLHFSEMDAYSQFNIITAATGALTSLIPLWADYTMPDFATKPMPSIDPKPVDGIDGDIHVRFAPRDDHTHERGVGCWFGHPKGDVFPALTEVAVRQARIPTLRDAWLVAMARFSEECDGPKGCTWDDSVRLNKIIGAARRAFLDAVDGAK